MNSSILLLSAVVVAVVMVATWLVSIPLRNASIVDPVWSLGFVAIGWAAWIASPDRDALRAGVLVALVTIWGVRLSLHLFTRNAGHGEDFRYRAMRSGIGRHFWIVSLFTVFGLQGVLMWIVSLPLQFGIGTTGSVGAGAVLAVVGALVWVVGFAFESIGDAQLRAFKADPASAGTVMDRGLWRFTRHPNYFGDAVVWWGIGIVALGAGGWAWFGLLGPAVMTFLLRRVSGVTMLERSLVKRRAGYEEYVRSTSPFLPRRPRTSRT